MPRNGGEIIMNKKNIITGAMALTMMLSPVLAGAQSIEATLRAGGFNDAQIAAVLAISAQRNSATSATAFNWNGTLIRFGSEGEQVRDLQNCMNRLGYSTGIADGVYGRNTFAGISAFQRDKGFDIDGIVGRQTAPGFESACNTAVSAVNTLTTPVVSGIVPVNEAIVVTSARATNEADFRKVSLERTDKTIKESATRVPVAEIEFTNENSDVTLNRMDIVVAYAGDDTGDQDDPWKVFKKAYIMDGNKVIASVDTSNKNAWQDQRLIGDYQTNGYATRNNRVRLTDIKTVFEKNKQHSLTVAFDIQKSVSLGSDGQSDWVFALGGESLRFTDEAGISHFLTRDSGIRGEIVEFAIEQDSIDDELTVRESEANPKSTGLKVNENRVSAFHKLMSFEVNVDRDSNPLETDTLVFAVHSSTSDIKNIIDEIEIRVGGQTFDDWDFVNRNVNGVDYSENSTQALIAVDTSRREGLVFENGKNVDVDVFSQFKASRQTNYPEGENITIDLPGSIIDLWKVEGADDLKAGQLKGAAEGNTHTLFVNGGAVELISIREAALSSGAQNARNVGSYTYVFRVSAFDNPIFIPVVARQAFAENGVVIKNASNGQIVDEIDALSLSSSATRVAGATGSYFRVSSNETFTLTVTDRSGAGDYYAELGHLNISSQANADTMKRMVLDRDAYRSDIVTLLN